MSENLQLDTKAMYWFDHVARLVGPANRAAPIMGVEPAPAGRTF